MIKITVYKTELGREPYSEFFKAIADPIAKTAVAKAITKMSRGLPGKVEPVGDGVSEHKVHVGKGYRIYFHNDGQEIVVLLGGGHKGKQSRDIEEAKRCLLDYKRQKKTFAKEG